MPAKNNPSGSLPWPQRPFFYFWMIQNTWYVPRANSNFEYHPRCIITVHITWRVCSFTCTFTYQEEIITSLLSIKYTVFYFYCPVRTLYREQPKLEISISPVHMSIREIARLGSTEESKGERKIRTSGQSRVHPPYSLKSKKPKWSKGHGVSELARSLENH